MQVHADFIDGGLLGVLKGWIELMPDGSLPNASIRTAVLKLLQVSPQPLGRDPRVMQAGCRMQGPPRHPAEQLTKPAAHRLLPGLAGPRHRATSEMQRFPSPGGGHAAPSLVPATQLVPQVNVMPQVNMALMLALLNVCPLAVQQLNVDVSMEGRREQLKRSALGKVVMFLFKLPDETPANRRLAKDLVYKWSRPIFDEYRDQAADEARHDREMGLAKARQARQAQASATAAGGSCTQIWGRQACLQEPDLVTCSRRRSSPHLLVGRCPVRDASCGVIGASMA